MLAAVTVELLPAPRYEVAATVGVTWGGQMKSPTKSSTFTGGKSWDTVDWDFTLHDDPQSDWALT